MIRFLSLGFVLLLLGVVVAWLVTKPGQIDVQRLAGLEGDPERGETVFWAGGCASCHSAPKAEGDARLILAGGRSFPSDFGTFYAPNISPDLVNGIGLWSQEDLANAMLYGTSPRGQHYYPAFPYTSYQQVSAQEIADLYSFLQTLPSIASPNKPHDVGFPFSIRRALGGWKLLFGGGKGEMPEGLSEEEQRGFTLVAGLGHCGECHTPRNALGGLDYSRWLGGAPNPSGKGRIPNITPAKLDWSEVDLVEYFTSGFTPEFDSAGGEMAEVVENLSKLPQSDRAAIAAYLKSVPAVP